MAAKERKIEVPVADNEELPLPTEADATPVVTIRNVRPVIEPRSFEKAPEPAPIPEPVQIEKIAEVPRERIREALASYADPVAEAAYNPMFSELVWADDDVVGLVAYALYKQNKRDWFTAFEATNARRPSSAELNSYIVGEATRRRVETYRRLAADALAKLTSQDMSAEALPPSVHYQAAEAVAPKVKRSLLQVPFLRNMIIGVSAAILAVIFVRYGLAWMFGR